MFVTEQNIFHASSKQNMTKMVILMSIHAETPSAGCLKTAKFSFVCFCGVLGCGLRIPALVGDRDPGQ
jgi:hypothetical protein